MSPKRRVKIRIGDLLVEKNIINKKQLEKALQLQKAEQKGKLLGQILMELKIVTEEELYSALATQLGYPYIKISNCVIDEDVMKLVPRQLAEDSNIMPVDKIGNILTIATPNPLAEISIEKLEKATGLKVRTFVGVLSELNEAIAKNYGAKKS